MLSIRECLNKHRSGMQFQQSLCSQGINIDSNLDASIFLKVPSKGNKLFNLFKPKTIQEVSLLELAAYSSDTSLIIPLLDNGAPQTKAILNKTLRIMLNKPYINEYLITLLIEKGAERPMHGKAEKIAIYDRCNKGKAGDSTLINAWEDSSGEFHLTSSPRV